MNASNIDWERGQSSVIGIVLIVGITLIGMLAVLFIGVGALDSAQQSAQVSKAESGMSQFDSKASLVALGSSGSQQIEFGQSNDDQFTVNSSAGNIKLLAVNGTNEQLITESDFGMVKYEVGDTELAYQGGGVWRYENGHSIMVSPPEYHYRDQTLTFPLIRVTGESGSIGDMGQIRIQGNGSDQRYPTASRRNPLTSGHVHVEVTSKYHEGWKDYFETRTEGAVSHDPANRTVAVNLTVPVTESFDTAVSATSSDSDAISNSGNPHGGFDTPQETGSDSPSVSPRVDAKINDCLGGGCDSLPTTPSTYSGTLENGTYFANGDLEISDTTYDTSNGTIHVVVNGDLKFKGGGGGPGTTHHDVTGGGSVKYYVKGGMNMEGNTGVNTNGHSSNLLLMVHSDGGDIDIGGTSQFTGLIYAPNSSLTIRGNSGLVGSIVVRKAHRTGNSDHEYEDPLGFEMEFETMTDITYLHVTENRIEVTRAGG